MHPQRLPHAQVQHDLLAAPRDRIPSHVAIEPLHLRALSAAAVTQPAKDLGRLARAKLKGDGGLRLQSCDGAAELEHRFRLLHSLGLVHERLEPGLGGFNLAGHVRELETDDGVVDERLTEGATLVCVFESFLVADARETEALDDDADAFMVEVCHYDWREEELRLALVGDWVWMGRGNGVRIKMELTLEALILLTDKVLYGYLDVFKGDICCSAGPDTLTVHLARRDTAKVTFYEQNANTVHTRTTCPDSGGKVVAPDAVGDPLLLAVDDVVLAVFGQLGFACKVGNVTAGIYIAC